MDTFFDRYPDWIDRRLFIGKALLPMLIEQTSFSAAYATVSPNPLIFIVAALFVLLTVKISIRKPVKMAAKVSPVEALRYTDSDTIKNGKKRKAFILAICRKEWRGKIWAEIKADNSCNPQPFFEYRSYQYRF